MDFLGKQVKHKMFGIGTVVFHNDSKIIVHFSDREMDFAQSSFRGYLEFVDPVDQAELITMLQKEDSEQRAAEAKDPTRHFVSPKNTQSRFTRSHDVGSSDRIKRQISPSNIAFKCNFCDGGKSSSRIGYMGVCSDEVMEYNICVAHHAWCSAENSFCMQYMNDEISRNELEHLCSGDGYVCYESVMFRDWTARAGFGLTGCKKNEPRKIRQVATNSLAVLTTREPYADESSRFIFGVFLINGVDQGNSVEEGAVWSDSKYRIELSPEEAHLLKFWNYHANDNSPIKPAWAYGLYRYLSDIEAAQILRDIAFLKKNRHEKIAAVEFLQYYCKIHHIDPTSIPDPYGALKR